VLYLRTEASDNQIELVSFRLAFKVQTASD